MPWPMLKDQPPTLTLKISKSKHNPVMTSINVINLPFHKILVFFGFMDNYRDRNRVPPYFPNQTT